MIDNASRYEFSSDFYEKFRQRVFTLLLKGYFLVRQKQEDFSNKEEEGINQVLCQCIENYLDSQESEEWCTCYNINVEHPSSHNNEIGKKSKRLDIRFRCSETRPAQLFVFEAKRLNNNTRPRDYFDDNGMQRFLKNIYPVYKQKEAAMLGYIQSKNMPFWTKWLNKHIENKRSKLFITTEPALERHLIVPELANTFRSCHEQSAEKRILLFHVLLDLLPIPLKNKEQQSKTTSG
jgi:hypothetical protein